MRILSLFYLILGALPSFAQSTAVFEEMKKKHPDEPTVYLERSEVIRVLIEGDSLLVTSEKSESMLHLKEQTDQFSSRKVYGSHFSQIKNLKAKTLVVENGKYKPVVVSKFTRNSDRQDGIFFDDSYYYAFDFPSIAPGSIAQLQYEESIRDARFISGFMFASYLRQEKATFTIKADKGVEFFFTILNDPDHKIRFSKTEKGKTITYQWTQENIPSIQSEQKSPAIRYFAPHLVCYVKSYQTKTKKQDVLPDIGALHHWYQTLVSDVNRNTSPELLKIIDEIKRESKTEDELRRNIFYWVQDNIHYIAFEQGMRGLIPNSGSYTIEKRYGDCKDMANLIVNMYQLAGLKAYHTWIGTREIPYRFTDFPTPVVDNHMIATYIDADGKYYFLDGTSNYTPFDFPSAMIQGKEALIATGSDSYKIQEVPVVTGERSVMTDSISIQLQGNEIKGSGRCSLSGYHKIFAGYQLDVTDDNEVKLNVAKLISKGSNKLVLNSYAINNNTNREKPTSITYQFTLQDYFQQVGDELYINLNMNKDWYNQFINTDLRKYPIETDYKYIKHEYTEMTIPPGYQVDFIPPDASYSGTLLGYDLSYKKEGAKIILSKKTYVNYLLLNPTDFPLWNEEVKRLSKVYKESIILKKK